MRGFCLWIGLSAAFVLSPPVWAGNPMAGKIPAQELGALPAKKPVIVDIKPACYTQAQYRAEQAVRYQTQLMVAGMLCQSANPQSYTKYQAFTQRNTPTIARG